MPQAAGVFYSVKPVVIAVVLQALLGLGRIAMKTRFLALTVASALLLLRFRVNSAWLVLGRGLIAFFVQAAQACIQ